MHGNAGSFVVLSQETHGLAGADDFADCPSCDMHHSQRVDDLMSLFVEARPYLGIYSEMAEVPTCPVEDWSAEQQRADLINLLLQVLASACRYPSRSVYVSESWKEAVEELGRCQRLGLGRFGASTEHANALWNVRVGPDV